LTMRKNKKLWIGLISSPIFLALIFYNADLHRMKEALMTVNYIYLPLAVMLSLVTNIFRSYRWKYALKPIRNIRALGLFPGIAIGYMVNNLLPARLGEFVRAYIVGKRENTSKSLILGTIVVERVFDGITLLCFLVTLSLFFSFPPWIKRVGIVASIFFMSAAVCLVFLTDQKTKVGQLIKKGIGLFSSLIAEKVGRLMDPFLSGLAVIKNKRNILLVFFFTAVVWLVEAMTYYIVGLSFSINLPIYVYLFVVITVNLGIMIPSAPGYVGTFEFFCMSVLALFSIEKNIALSFAIVLHAILFIPITILGMIYFYKEDLSFSKINIQEPIPVRLRNPSQ